MGDTADTLERFVAHLTRDLTPELAKLIAELPKLQARFNELADRANEGLLDDEERGEYAKCVEYMDFVVYARLKAPSRTDASAPSAPQGRSVLRRR